MRYNSEGIPRDELVWALTQRRLVREARKIDSCLLCRRDGVNEAALCPICWAILDEIELTAATRWTSGART